MVRPAAIVHVRTSSDMTEPVDSQRRRFITTLAAVPLLVVRDVVAAPPTFTLTLTGQALMTRSLCNENYQGLADVIAEVRRGDVAITDLETPIRTGQSGAPVRKGMFLHEAGIAELQCLREFGFNLLTLANNHAGDFGRAGVLATLDAVHKAGFRSAGSGRNLAAAGGAGCFTVGGESVAVIAMATGKIREGAAAAAELPGINELRLSAPDQPDAQDLQRILASIAGAARHSRVVVCLHNHDWGEDMRITREWTRRHARACIDAGASVFFAHGAPLLHGVEMYRGAPIFHCLGSLIFQSRTPPGYYPPEVWESVIAHLRWRGGRLQQIELVPVVLNEYGDDPLRQDETRGRPRLARDADAMRILKRLSELSKSPGTRITIMRNRGYVEWS